MSQFEVGSPVSVKDWDNDDTPDVAKNGRVGTVVEVWEPGGEYDVAVEWDGDEDRYSYADDELIPW
jgi:hypothetical protein